jgi:hypothetical protein
MTTSTLTTVTRPSEDALIGLDRALSFFEQQLEQQQLEQGVNPPADMLLHLRAAQSWLMTAQSEIHADDVVNDR